MTWARGHYDSIRGRIASGWSLAQGRLQYDVTIPANTTAMVYVPAKDAASVTESGKPATHSGQPVLFSASPSNSGLPSSRYRRSVSSE